MTVTVRWQGKTRGAFGFALIFLFLFASRQKEHEQSKTESSFYQKSHCVGDDKPASQNIN